jgi:hypothetical protein
MLRFSIRELILITTVVGLAIPLLYSATRNWYTPQHEFRVTQGELLSWIQGVDSSVRVNSYGAEGDFFDNQTRLTIEFASPGDNNIASIRAGILQKCQNEGWELQSRSTGREPLGLRFMIYKGPACWRVYVLETPSRGSGASESRIVRTYYVICINDSK